MSTEKLPVKLTDEQRQAMEAAHNVFLNSGFQSYQVQGQPVAQVMGPPFTIEGTDSQVAEIALQPGQVFITEPGTICHMAKSVKLSLTLGGCCDAATRAVVADESFVRLKLENQSDTVQYVGVTPNFPAKIAVVDLSQHPHGFTIKNGAFMASLDPEVKFDYRFVRSLGAAFLGGQGFILNSLHGRAPVFLNAGGTLLSRYLAPGEPLLLDHACLVGFENSVQFSVQRVGSLAACCCAGEGLVFSKLVGPGLVLIQSMPFEKLVGAVVASNTKSEN